MRNSFVYRPFHSIASVVCLLTAVPGSLCQETKTAVGKAVTGSSIFMDATVDSIVHGSVGTDKPASFAVATAPQHGELTLGDQKQGDWTYKPAKGFEGPDQFRIVASDGHSLRVNRIVISLAPAVGNGTYYVDAAKGSDKNAGTKAEPFATIQAAHNVTRPGDTVLVRAGVYPQTSLQAVLEISRSGLPGAPITYKACPGEHPVLTAKTAWNTVLITASYIRLEGFEIAGNGRNVSLKDAEKVYDRFVQGPRFESYGEETSFSNTNGISIRPANKEAPLRDRIFPRHIEIVGNHVHDVPGGGISAQWSDYITIAHNEVHDTSNRTIYATSGISILGSQDTDEKSPAYRMFIVNNRVYHNESRVKWIAVQHLSDGNGIIFDSNRNEDPKGAPFRGRTLIANNLVYENGGAGIQIYSSDNVDVAYNTVVKNSLTPGLDYGQIWAHDASNLRIENNIAVAGRGAKINELFTSNKNVVYDYNVYSGDRKPGMFGPHDILADPKFVDAAAGNFHLAAGSPAIDSGNDDFDVEKDLDGGPRRLGHSVDRGAFEIASP